MKPKVTETIELTISYFPNGPEERVNLPDLRDALAEGAHTFLPFGATLISSLAVQAKSAQVEET